MSRTNEPLLLVTGATGFIGKRLVLEILRARPNCAVVALVLRNDVARVRRLRDLGLPEELRGRFNWVLGDITLPNLGLTEHAFIDLVQYVREIYHLAAFYRLDVSAETAWKTNYLGTKEVLSFARKCLHLERFHHFSSLVAGSMKPKHERPFLNDYERTKYLSEVLVRESLGSSVATLNIFRPGVVVGDATAGATDKFDGLYFCLLFLWRFRGLLRHVPIVMQGRDVNFPVVPVDFVVRAATHISRLERRGAFLYPLVEDQRISWQMLYHYLFQRLVKENPKIQVHPRSVKKLFALPLMERLLGFPSATLSYVDYEIPYEISDTRAALRGSNIEFPRFWEYVDRMVDFFLAHAHETGQFLPPTEPKNAGPAEASEVFPFSETAQSTGELCFAEPVV